MASTTFKIEGLSDLGEALKELPKSTATGVIKRVLLKAGEPIRSDAEQAAPVRRGTLKASFTAGTKLSRRQKSQHRKESRVEIFVGPGSLPQAITQEFGAAQHGPQPFMRPAWDANKQRALDGIKDDLTAEIEKTRQRLARKAARLAAKIQASK